MTTAQGPGIKWSLKCDKTTSKKKLPTSVGKYVTHWYILSLVIYAKYYLKINIQI